MVRKILVSLSGILADSPTRRTRAGGAERCPQSPLTQHRPVRCPAKRKLVVGIDIPTPSEVRTIITHLRGRARPLPANGNLYRPARLGELRGLHWSNVDLARNEIHVRHRADRFGTIGAPKSASGQRTIPLLPMVVNALGEWRLASPRSGADLVLSGENGRPFALGTIIRFVWPSGANYR